MKKSFFIAFAVLITVAGSMLLVSCKGKVSDSDIQTAVNDKISSNATMAGITASVAEGVVTLSGQAKDDASKNSLAADVKTIKGVKDVVNNITVAPAAMPVTITPDDPLKEKVSAALSNYSGITADVNDGVVTLKGAVKRSDLQKLMMTLNALKPKKIDNNQLTINK